MKLEPGDVVRLKSGGPEMTIMGLRTYEVTIIPSPNYGQLGGYSPPTTVPPKYDRPVTCTWMSEDDVVKQATFEEVCLKAVGSDE